ncbi:MAG: hypothetical protein L6Q71_12385, partial [Planctomycetes bacterium]|nr:hypothetical protein [Planctomycetota bacterium]
DAGAQDAEIQVFCVEHGRWALQGKDAEKCRDGAFYTDKSMPQCDLAVKKAAIETKQQGRVWSEVASNNMALNVARKTSSGTFRATFDDPETREKIEKNVAVARKLAESQVVGFAVYVEGEMVAMDVFESCGLAQKLADKLLRSYVITGLSGGYKDEVTVANDASNAEAEDVATAGEIDQVESQADRSCCLSPRERFAQQHATNNVGRAAAPRTGNEELAVNDRTANTRSYKENALDYACNDKKSGKAVQQSFMRR